MPDDLALGTTPLAGASPTGDNVRYDDAFTQIESEIAKLEHPAGGDIDWSAVAAGCRNILAEKSKDLLVAAWLARALWQTQRLAGLASGLGVIRGLLTTWWEALHPLKPRPRRAALEWLSDKLAPLLDPKDALSPQGREALESCKKSCDEIIAAIGGRFAPDDHGLSALRRRLGELGAPVASASPAASASPVKSPSGPASASTASGALGEDAVPYNAGPVAAGPIASRAEAIAKLQEIADFFAKTEPHSPIGYLLNRAVSWNSKTFQDIFSELLKGKGDAQTQLWDSLGLKPPGSK
ncbi:hypothetical protein LBMAG53_32150 [Planctomycetota bacterium]|nr:hypothetical protein LBMAG53_32150 [Planctomycetota bacterium]